MSGTIDGGILVALPQMLRLGYCHNRALGMLCAGGSLDTMIRPRSSLIIA